MGLAAPRVSCQPPVRPTAPARECRGHDEHAPPSSQHQPILWLQDPVATSARRTGGKAAALAALAGRLPIPAGFVVVGDFDPTSLELAYAALDDRSASPRRAGRSRCSSSCSFSPTRPPSSSASTPVAPHAGEVLVNAAFGLGESIVGGTVRRDDFALHRTSLAVTRRTIADKRRMTVRAAGGSREVDVPVPLRRVPSITDEQARAAASTR
ncbi:MAG TPA: PEP/pyruvate-binding domain-containing protein [Solirubrobacteraceae bacterium]|nr:PEP/pyruvate-binding domain-containing protein [Solirubrobacteraceae bacterium]